MQHFGPLLILDKCSGTCAYGPYCPLIALGSHQGLRSPADPKVLMRSNVSPQAIKRLGSVADPAGGERKALSRRLYVELGCCCIGVDTWLVCNEAGD